MKNSIARATSIISLVLLLLSFAFCLQHASAKHVHKAKENPRHVVYVMGEDVPAGSIFKPNFLVERKAPRDFEMPDGAVHSKATLLDRKAKAIISEGQIICTQDLLPDSDNREK
jgi:hypothetical protein